MYKTTTEVATFAGGCFWCTEAIFKRLKGVESVVSGFAGGKTKNPKYEDVVYQDTGHAESVQITFNPNIISFERLLDVFWATHNPTTLNRQNYDVGPMYRSIIFYHDEKQKQIALESKKRLEKEGIYEDRIVTEITPFTNFYKAEDYHQNYYEKNKMLNMYCPVVVAPKIKKLLDKFNSEIKEEYKNETAN